MSEQPDSGSSGASRARVVLIQDRCIAVIERRRDGRYYYVLAGGAIEDGETPAAAARREAWEELGVVVQVQRLLAHILALPDDLSSHGGRICRVGFRWCNSLRCRFSPRTGGVPGHRHRRGVARGTSRSRCSELAIPECASGHGQCAAGRA
jgi:8-oxo-dGTP pyrophosphatase MutT (NUDIX family)